MNLQQPSGRIIASLELQISHVQKNGTNYSEIEDNVVVKALIFNPSIKKGLTLVKTHANDTDTYSGENETRLDDTETSIYLPPEVIEEARKYKTNNRGIPISFVIYKNASLFGTDTGMNLMEEIAKMSSHIISSEVISVNVDGGPMENLTPPVILRFFLPEKDKVCDQPLCVYYVPNGTDNGIWSTDGCLTSTEKNLTVCKCDHLSSFTVLMGVQLSPGLDHVMKLVTWIGSSLSILGLTICTLSFVLVKALRVKQSAQIHFNLCISLIAFYVTFLALDWATQDPNHCKWISSAIQYFCLVAVSWMTVEAVNMYFLFVKYERSNIPHFLPVSLALAYGM
ncbi:adhesion G protein-coupled receptor E3-like [Apostichopus japonicus]|uniref:adhesion G protein-coupled receptor E3-like n=1 Tax=Stichopus japonicus TaxID=307972 RepID=UPI003AB4C6B2